MAYMSPDPLSANWSYDSAIDLFSLNTMMPESFPMDIPNDMLWDPKDLPADFFAPPSDINGFTVSHDDSLSSDESDESFSPTNFMSSTPPSTSLDLPSPIALSAQPSQLQLQPQPQLIDNASTKRKQSTTSTTSTAPRYSSSPDLAPQQPAPTNSRKRNSTADDSNRGRNAAKRAAHNIIEKRYRTNMNAKFVALEKAMAVKPHGVSKSNTSAASTAGKGSSSASLKKSEILSNAIAYMQELQEVNERLRKEIVGLERGRRYC
ncbi:hypothetical protein BJY04DRAFT_202970 [Aspergillus karnatakaensis]|uniref:uncharacterized protein n=1 Tax=Aspergillus karnatakaensis TaxID=1810916 RepID=UPI003CCDD1B1